MPFGIIEVQTTGPLAGTELLIRDERSNVESETKTVHLKRITYKGADTVLIPQPSEHDPNDPLLWSRWKKELAFLVLVFNNIVFAAMPGPVLAPSTFALAGILGVPITSVAELSGYQLLVVGAIGPLVSVLAQKYGKRPQFLFAVIFGTIGTVICIAASKEYHYDTLLAGRMVQGLGATAWESLSLAAVGDIFYLHERGFRTALIVATLTCTTSLVSIIAGALTQNVGWQMIFVTALPFDVVGLLGAIFLLPETQFRRGVRHSPATETSERPRGLEKETSAIDKAETLVIQTAAAQRSSSVVTPRKTYIQTLAPFSGVYSQKNLLHLLSEIFVHLINPAVWWIQLVSAVLIALYVVTAYITAQIWSAPPYLLNVAQNGYFYTGGFLGGLLATAVGPICDWSARTLAKRNGGVFEAEFRLPINALGAVFTTIGWFLFMWDVNNPRPNGYLLGAFCYGLVCVGISIPSTSAGLYILDSFPNQATEVFVLQMMVKNFAFYAFSTMMNTWAGRAGPGAVFQTWGTVSLLLIATSIPMYICGKANRRVISNLYARHKIFRALG